MAILNNSNAITTTGGYDVNNSLRFRQSASARLSRTPATAGNRKTWTFSAWVKIGIFTPAGAQQGLFSARSTSTDQMTVFYQDEKISFQSGGSKGSITTNAVLRDPSAWYHLVVVLDATNATAADRAIIYLNGTRQSVTTATSFTNADHGINATIAHNIGAEAGTNTLFFDGYMAEINFIDGSAKAVSDFGATDSTTGVWQPKAYTGTYGTNGFYLKFSDIATTSGSNAGLGKDFSGNTNYWTTNNISVTSGTTYDAMTDSPTNTSATVANYCVLNPVDNASGATITNGNLETTSASAAYKSNFGTLFVTSGKWYAEFTVVAGSNDSRMIAGIGTKLTGVTNQLGNDTYSYSINWSSSTSAIYKRTNNTDTTLTSTGNLTNGSVIMVALDLDNNKLWFGQDGTWFDSGNPSSGTNQIFSITAGEYTIMPCTYEDGKLAANYGQRPFAYTPPTGFVRLNTFNLPTPTILQGNKYMDATLWTGDGATTRSITNASSFKPDLIWIKGRSNTGSNLLQDSNRGFGTATKLSSNSTNAENNASADATDPIYGYITAANSNGFSVNVGTTPAQTNNNGVTYVGWQWQAGQGSTSSNTSGSITSTVSVNATAGFSIVTYTGTGANATVGHGLGVAPRMMIIKRRNQAEDWSVYHISIGATNKIFLDLTNATSADSTMWNNTTPTSSLFSIGTNTATNANTGTYVAYCWAEIAGFSKFGSYIGNGSTDGPFVYLGFRPKFVLVKEVTTGGTNWLISDSSRDTYNLVNDILIPNLFNAEDTAGNWVDFVSNGFKIRYGSVLAYNQSGQNYIYMAFAENPFKNANAR